MYENISVFLAFPPNKMTPSKQLRDCRCREKDAFANKLKAQKLSKRVQREWEGDPESGQLHQRFLLKIKNTMNKKQRKPKASKDGKKCRGELNWNDKL